MARAKFNNFDQRQFVDDVARYIATHEPVNPPLLAARAGIHAYSLDKILIRGSLSDINVAAGLARECDLDLDDYVIEPG